MDDWKIVASSAMDDYGFTPAERRVAWLLLAGKMNKEIATERRITLQTVKEHLRAMYSKADAASRTELVLRLLKVL
jgi:DNA-binding NarL/FixJ family response regulator